MTSATTELCITFNHTAQETSITKVHYYAYRHLLSIKLQTRNTKSSATRKQNVKKTSFSNRSHGEHNYCIHNLYSTRKEND